MREALTDMWRSVALFVPKALAFLAILVVGYLVARALRALTDRILERVHFDRAVQRGGVATALARGRYDASDIVARLVYYTVALFTLQLAFGIWGPNPVSDLIGAVVAWLPRAFVAIVIVVVATAIAAWARDVIAGALSGLPYGRLLATLAWVFIVGLGGIAALNQIGVATTVTMPVLIAVLATVSGILIVGVGGGLVRPMQQRWDRWLDRAAEQTEVIAEQARAYQAGQRDAERAMAADAAPAAGDDPDATVVVAGGPAADTAAADAPRPPSFAPGSASVYRGAGERGGAGGSRAEEERTQVLPPTPG